MSRSRLEPLAERAALVAMALVGLHAAARAGALPSPIEDTIRLVANAAVSLSNDLEQLAAEWAAGAATTTERVA